MPSSILWSTRYLALIFYPEHASEGLLSERYVNPFPGQIVAHILPCAFVSLLGLARCADPAATPLADHRQLPCILELILLCQITNNLTFPRSSSGMVPGPVRARSESRPYGMGLRLTVHGTGYPLAGGYDDLCINLTK